MLSKFFHRDKSTKPHSDEKETVVIPGQVFRWPKGAKITAVDMVIVALPKALFREGEKMEAVIDADDEMNIAMPPDSDNVYLYIQSGMSVTIKRSSESYLVANDNAPRKIRITEPKTSND